MVAESGCAGGGESTFRDVLNSRGLQIIFERFSRVSGFSASITAHPEGTLLFGEDYQAVCADIHRIFLPSEACCEQNLLKLSSDLKESGDLFIRQCEHGLAIGVSPIIVKGTHMANLIIGPVLFERIDVERLKRESYADDRDMDSRLDELRELPVVTKWRLEESVMFLHDIVVLMAEEGLSRNRPLTDSLSRRDYHDMLNTGLVITIKWKSRPDWGVEYISSNVGDMLGYSPEEFLSGKISYEQIVHEDDVERVREEVRANISSGVTNFKHQPFRIVCRDNEIIWVDNYTTIHRDASGDVAYYFSYVMNVTSLKESEEVLRKRGIYLSALNRTKEILLTAESETDSLFQQVVTILGSAASASRAYIFRNHYSEEGEMLTSQIAEYCAEGIEAQIRTPNLHDFSLPAAAPRWAETLAKGELIQGRVADFPRNERDVLEPQGIKTILVIPITSNEDFIGFIGFDNCVSEREWDLSEQNFLKAAANDLAQFVERNRAYEQLKAEYVRFQTTMDALNAAVYVADMKTHELLFLNRYGRELLGEDLIGEKCYKVLQRGQTEPCPFCTNHLLVDEKGVPRKPYVWVFRNTTTGNWYHCQDQAISWPDGRIVRLEIATDITDRKLDEAALRESEDKFRGLSKLYRLMSDNIPDLVWAKDLDGKFIFVNKALCEKLLIAKDTDEPIGKSDIFFAQRQRNLHPERDDWHTFGEMCVDSDQVVLQRRRPARFDEFGNIQGEFLYLDVYKAPLLDDDGEIIGTVGHARIVTKEKEIEKALKDSEERLSLALEGADLGTWDWNIRDGAVVFNERLSEVFGCGLYECKPYIDIWEGLLHPEDAQAARQRLDAHLRGETPFYEAEYRLWSKDGGWKWILDRGRVVERDEHGAPIRVSGTHLDITDRKHAEEKLKKSEEELHIILKSIGDGVIAVDMKGRITHMNPVAEQLTGWEKHEAIGSHLSRIFRIVNEDTGEYVKSSVDMVLAGEGPVSIVRRSMLIAKDGTGHNVAGSASLIRDDAGEVHGAVLVVRDITEKLRIEEELYKSKKLESLGVLAGGIAHDFNNLLTGLFGNIELAKLQASPNDQVYRYLENADQALERATHLTKQLLVFAKGGDPVLETVDLKSILKDVVEFNLSGSNVKSHFRLPSDLWQLKADKGQIGQVIANLTINAKEAMPDGGTLYIEAENCTDPDTGLTGDFVKLVVRDEGMGIPAKYLNNIFDPYFSTKQTGSGLGLATIHSIIGKHSGQIRVNSMLGQGAEFTIYLPAQPFSANQADATASESAEQAENAAGYVLVMDDERIVREVAVCMLESLGYSVDSAAEGAEAIEKYTAAEKDGSPFDVVIMDVTIAGGMGGKEAVKNILTIDPKAKVIVASGYSTDPVIANYSDYGFKGRLVKPFKMQDLKKELDRVMKA